MINPCEMTNAYIEAALWSSVDDQDNNLEGYTLASGEYEKAVDGCERFIVAAGEFLNDWTSEQAGYDFWLTRNGHGTGFWDRGKQNGDALTAICGCGTSFPCRDLYR